MTEKQTPARSPYHDLLPLGEVVDSTPLLTDDLSCFDAVTLRPLAPMLVPEEPRRGEVDRAECGHCRPSEHTIWRDERWHLNAGFLPSGLPFLGGLAPRTSTAASRTRRSTC